MLSGDRRRSQLQMRYRVAFQLCTVGAVLGGVYYNAYKASVAAAMGEEAQRKAPTVDARMYMRDAAKFDLQQDPREVGNAKEAELR